MTAPDRYLALPFRLTPEGNVALATGDEHVRQRIEQILFTAPGERVMLPEFGSGVRDLVFGPNGEMLAAAAEFTIRRELQRAMGREVRIDAVDVVSREADLRITIAFTRTRDLHEETLTFRVNTRERRP